jgi:hypothetical protein
MLKLSWTVFHQSCFVRTDAVEPDLASGLICAKDQVAAAGYQHGVTSELRRELTNDQGELRQCERR